MATADARFNWSDPLLLDAQLIARAREEAETLLDRDPRLTQPEHAPLRALVARIAEDVVAEIH